jgi:hypothetical protein
MRSDDLHAERSRTLCDAAADPAQPDDPELRPANPANRSPARDIPLAVLDRAIEAVQSAQQRQDRGDRVIGHLLRAVARGVTHLHPTLAKAFEVDVVEADARGDDKLKLRGVREVLGANWAIRGDHDHGVRARGFGPAGVHGDIRCQQLASLMWTRATATVRAWLPVLGPIAMGAALLGVGIIADGGGWPLERIAPLLYVGGIAHACSFSPLTDRMAAAVHPAQTSDLSGLLLTASLIGQVLGIAAFVGVYLAAAPDGPAHAFALTTGAIAAALIVTTACAYQALHHRDTPRARVAESS